MITEKLKEYGLGIAELIGVITTFLLVTGLSYAYGYYDAGLNAKWIINLISTKELLIFNIKLAFCLVLGLMYFILF